MPAGIQADVLGGRGIQGGPGHAFGAPRDSRVAAGDARAAICLLPFLLPAPSPSLPSAAAAASLAPSRGIPACGRLLRPSVRPSSLGRSEGQGVRAWRPRGPRRDRARRRDGGPLPLGATGGGADARAEERAEQR